jgi:hypothetical protein
VIGRNASWNSSSESPTSGADDLLVPAPLLKIQTRTRINMSVHPNKGKQK